MIIVPAMVNKTTSAHFMFDTGTTNCFISEKLASKLKLKPVPLIINGQQSYANGVPLDGVTLDSIVSSGFSLHGDVAVWKKGQVTFDDGFDGILGLGAFSTTAVAIYPAEGVIMLYPHGNLTQSRLEAAGFGANAARLPITWNKSKLIWQCSVSLSAKKITEAVSLTLDTGFNATRIPLSAVRSLGLDTVSATRSEIFDRGVADFRCVVPSMTWGPLSMKDHIVSYSKEQPEPDAALGMDVLGGYPMLIDFPAAVFYLSVAAPMNGK